MNYSLGLFVAKKYVYVRVCYFTYYIKNDIMNTVMIMKEIGVIFGVVFLFGIIFVIPNEIKSSNVGKYNFNYLVRKENDEPVPVSSNVDISFDMDLRTKSKYTAQDFNIMLSGTDLQGLGETFKKCDDKGINSLFVVALACHESNYGRSSLSKDKNNIFGFRAYDRDPYNNAKQFSSKEDCIEFVSKYICDNYLNENGKYFNGDTITSINVKYASDKSWANKIYNIMKKLEKRV